MALRLSNIDNLTRPDHSYLRESDICYHLHEYTKGLSYKESKTNGLIFNLKIKPHLKVDRPDRWKWKLRDIETVAKEFASTLEPAWLKGATLVPIPPSKSASNPDYDDRMTKVLEAIGKHAGIKCDVRELIIQVVDKEPTHTKDELRDVGLIKADYRINESLSNPPPTIIGIFDDVLTTGAHFRAAESLLSDRFSGASIAGFFIARRVIPEVEFDLSGFIQVDS